MSPLSTAPVIAAILAGGTGSRVPGEMPKQLRELAGRPLLAHSLVAFENAPEITGIVLVSHAQHIAAAGQVARGAAISKLIAVVPGGETRSESSRAALAALPLESAGKILIHDAARPLVDAQIISDVVAALETHRAVGPATPPSDTIVEAHDDTVTAMPARESLRRMQTPQGFHIQTLRGAYELAAADPSFAASDDCGVVHRYMPDVAIKLVAGSPRNLKVTHEQDLAIAETLLDA